MFSNCAGFVISDAASIVAISENVIVDQGEEATLSCTADGNPLADDTVTWKREDMDDFDMRTSVTYDKNGTFFLKISDVTREDLGSFQCITDNGVGNTSSRDVMLIVKRKSLEVIKRYKMILIFVFVFVRQTRDRRSAVPVEIRERRWRHREINLQKSGVAARTLLVVKIRHTP